MIGTLTMTQPMPCRHPTPKFLKLEDHQMRYKRSDQQPMDTRNSMHGLSHNALTLHVIS